MGKTAVLGAGISGLTTAWHLKKLGIEADVYEKGLPGGVIQSVLEMNAVLDLGPNSLRDKTGELTRLVEELGIEKELIQVTEASKTRCIVRNGEIQYLKPGPLTLLSKGLLSLKGKIRLLSEPFQPARDIEDESVGEFLRRRIGNEAVDYLADPFFSGIYAGDIDRLSKLEVIPEIAAMERESGSIFKGFLKKRKGKEAVSFKPRIFNFKKGLQTLTDAIAAELSDQLIREEVIEVGFEEEKFTIRTPNRSAIYDQVISCIPAYSLGSLLKDHAPNLADQLHSIIYPSVLSTQVIFNEEANLPDAEAFGFLIPRKEGYTLLGAIWKSSIFPEHTPDNKQQFTLLSGGAHHHIAEAEINKIENKVITEFKELMGIRSEPEYVYSKYWPGAIPQQNLGYHAIRKSIRKFESINSGFIIGGNYVWGVSIPDCIKMSKLTAERLKSLL